MANDCGVLSHRQSGLTLLEMLVVLVLTGLIATLLLQSVTYVLGNFSRVTNAQNRFEREVLVWAWFRDSVAQAAAIQDPEFAFMGRGREFKTATMSAVHARAGKLAKVSWWLVSTGAKQQLWYREDQSDPQMIHQWHAPNASFQYRDVNGNWSDNWPPDEQAPIGQLPFRVKLSTEFNGKDWQIFAAHKLRRIPRYDFRDAVGEQGI